MRLTSRQTDLVLEGLLLLSLGTGVLSWLVPLDWARAVTLVHAVSGVSILVVAPLKITGSVRAGFRRRRATRWVSATFGLLVLATIVLGMLHATGVWSGVGYWSALWTHVLFAFLAVPLFVWHVASRPSRPSVTDLDRRALVSTGTVAVAAAAVVAAQEVTVRVLDLPGADRAGTGSHELASFDPAAMPSVSWIDDTAPDLDPEDWPLEIEGARVDVPTIAARSRPLVASLDCTGGWYSDQSWDVVALADIVPPGEGRSIRVTSATGYSRIFSNRAADRIYLATGYNGRPLRRGHGAPLRIVAPGRRGPWWVKWVTSIDRTDRPAWAQLPLPPT